MDGPIDDFTYALFWRNRGAAQNDTQKGRLVVYHVCERLPIHGFTISMHPPGSSLLPAVASAVSASQMVDAVG